MQMLTTLSGLKISRIGYAEKPLRNDPALHLDENFLYSIDERAAILEEAVSSDINFLLAVHERDAATLGELLKALSSRDRVVLASTDGDFLSRCDASEAAAGQAIETAIARKLRLLQTDRLDAFFLHDFRADVHTEARLLGARKALDQARTDGTIRAYGAICEGDPSALVQAIQSQAILPDIVIAPVNAYDQSALQSLVPTCQENNICFFASRPFAWIGGVAFPRFPNAWRLRNMTMNFFGQTAGQAHLRWLLSQPGVGGAMISMNEAGQPKENALAFKGQTLPSPPNAVEALFQSFRDAILETDEGWTGLLQDPTWEVRQMAEEHLAATHLRVDSAS